MPLPEFWNETFDTRIVSDRTFIDVQNALEFLGQNNRRKREGWRPFDAFLKKQGLDIDLHFLKAKDCHRQYLSVEAFLSLLFGGQCLQDSNSTLSEHERQRANNRIYELRSGCVQTLTRIENGDPNEVVRPIPREEGNNDDVGNAVIMPHELEDAHARPNVTVKSKEILSTSELKAREDGRRNRDDTNTKSASRTLRNRVRSQEQELARISRTIHNGGKLEFCLALGLSVSDTRKRLITDHGEGWDGRLSVTDVIDVLKNITVQKCGRNMCLYDIIVKFHSAERHHITAGEILMLVDTKSVHEMISYLRERLPGFLASERETRRLKSKMNDGMKVLEPRMTATGMSINPMRLRQCLLYLYHWLGAEEWWRLFGDASKLGREQTTIMGLTCINNSQILREVKIHSPMEVWMTNIFFLKDTRANIEANLGPEGGELGEFIKAMKRMGHHIFLSADSMFCDALFGGNLGPTTVSGWNMFMNMTKDEKGNIDPTTGRRSTLMYTLNRTNETKFLPIDEDHVGIDPNHAVSRIVEKLIKLVVHAVSDIAAQLPRKEGKQMRAQSLRNLVANIADRDVHRGKEGVFTLRFDDNDELKDFTLNTTSAEVILAPPYEFGSENNYPDILDNVIPDTPYLRPIPQEMVDLLNLEDDVLTYKQLIQMTHRHMWGMYKLLTLDPVKLRDNSNTGSTFEGDYEFGLSADQISEYRDHADKFHRLFCFVYDASKLTPYMMKLIDVIPLLLEKFPFHSTMRLATEAGEHRHYLNMTYYYQHTLRGGGINRPTVLKSLFQWQWRCLNHRIQQGPRAISEAFDDFVKDQLGVVLNDHTVSSDEEPLVQVDNDEANDNQLNSNTEDQLQFDEESTDQQHSGSPIASTEPPNDVQHATIARTSQPTFRFQIIVICGRLRMSREAIAAHVQNLGGNIWTSQLPDERIPVNGLIISSQQECNRDPSCIVHNLAEGFRRGWAIVSESYIEDCAKRGFDVGVENYFLDTSKLSDAPQKVLQSLRVLPPPGDIAKNQQKR